MNAKKLLKVLVLIILVITFSEYIYIRRSPEAYIMKFEDKLIALAYQYEGTFVDSKTASLRYKPLFWYGLTYLDARNGVNGCAFSLSTIFPIDEQITIEYYYQDKEVEEGLSFSDFSSEKYTISNLGINQKGYRTIKKANKNWLIIRSNIPT